MTMHHLCSIAWAMAVCAAPAAGDVVERRGAASPVEGRITVLDDAGVAIQSDLGGRQVIPWDRVRSIAPAAQFSSLDEFTAMAEDLWRARTRIERNDTALAEPLLERWQTRLLGDTHETALVLAEGLLRCRLARGANGAAVIPALEVARLRRAGITTDSYASLPPVLDETTWLCPTLPPVWVHPREMTRLDRELAAYEAGDDEVVAALAAGYRRAARRQLGEPVDEDAPAPSAAGAALLVLLADAEAATPEVRRPARQRLLAQLDAMPPWSAAWGRFTAGRSLLLETGRGRRQRGLLQLAHLPARHGRGQPYLAGLALERMATVLDGWGQAAPAARLREDLAVLYPGHPLHRDAADLAPNGGALPEDRS